MWILKIHIYLTIIRIFTHDDLTYYGKAKVLICIGNLILEKIIAQILVWRKLKNLKDLFKSLIKTAMVNSNRLYTTLNWKLSVLCEFKVFFIDKNTKIA